MRCGHAHFCLLRSFITKPWRRCGHFIPLSLATCLSRFVNYARKFHLSRVIRSVWSRFRRTVTGCFFAVLSKFVAGTKAEVEVKMDDYSVSDQSVDYM